jgi:type IV pilus assembly protein PilW
MQASIPSWVSRHQRGIGLVEIMVALTLGLVLMGGVLQVFLSNKQTYRMQEAHARLQENGRFAIGKISRDIREAGYWGCASHSVSTSLKTTLKTLGTYQDYFYDFTRIVEGFEWTGSAWTPAADDTNVFKKAFKGDIDTPGSDIFTVRAPLGPNIRVIKDPKDPDEDDDDDYMVSSTGDPYINNPPNNGLKDSDIVMVSDCTSATIMQVTDAPPAGLNDPPPGGASGPLTHAGSGTPGNSTSDLGVAYRNDSEVVKIDTISYYIRAGDGGLPGLYRREGDDPSEEMIEGVENMQILYGEDTDGDFSANCYLPANSVSDWANVVSVRVNLLLMTLDDNLTAAPQTFQFNRQTFPASRRLRRVFTTTVGIRNRLAN